MGNPSLERVGASTLSEHGRDALGGEASPRIERAGWAGFVVLSIVLVGLFLLGSMRDAVLRFVHDDAFYYFGIAENLAKGHGSTFDGLTRTNGYHPLWQYIVVIPAAIMRVEEVARVTAALGVGLLAMGTILIHRALRRVGNGCAWLAVYWVGGTLLFAAIYGLESPLAIFLFAAVIAFWPMRERDLVVARGIGWGVLSSLLVLARVDSLIWVAAMDLAFVCRRVLGGGSSRRAAIRYSLAAAFTQFVILGAYFGSNRVVWGHLLPISALVKAGRTETFNLGIPRSLLFVLSIPVTALGLIAIWRAVAALIRGRMGSLSPPAEITAGLGLGNALYLLAIFVRGGVETYNWYFALLVFSGAWILPVLLEEWTARVSERTRGLVHALAILGCLAILLVTVKGKAFRGSSFVDSYDLAVSLARFPENSLVFAATDCGTLGAMSRQHCLNLDGLTGSFDFQESLRANAFPEFLKNRGLNTAIRWDTPVEGSTVSLSATPGIHGVRRTALLEVGAPQVLTVGPESHNRTVYLYVVESIRGAGAPPGQRPQ